MGPGRWPPRPCPSKPPTGPSRLPAPFVESPNATPLAASTGFARQSSALMWCRCSTASSPTRPTSAGRSSRPLRPGRSHHQGARVRHHRGSGSAQRGHRGCAGHRQIGDQGVLRPRADHSRRDQGRPLRPAGTVRCRHRPPRSAWWQQITGTAPDQPPTGGTARPTVATKPSRAASMPKHRRPPPCGPPPPRRSRPPRLTRRRRPPSRRAASRRRGRHAPRQDRPGNRSRRQLRPRRQTDTGLRESRSQRLCRSSETLTRTVRQWLRTQEAVSLTRIPPSLRLLSGSFRWSAQPGEGA